MHIPKEKLAAVYGIVAMLRYNDAVFGMDCTPLDIVNSIDLDLEKSPHSLLFSHSFCLTTPPPPSHSLYHSLSLSLSLSLCLSLCFPCAPLSLSLSLSHF